jgi:hypothetical protein
MLQITEAILDYKLQTYRIAYRLDEAGVNANGVVTVDRVDFDGKTELEQIDLLRSKLIEAVTGKSMEIIGNAIDLMSQVETVGLQVEEQTSIVEVASAQVMSLRKSLQNLVLAVNLSDEEMADLVNLYDDWTTGVDLVAGDIVRHGGKLYRVVQAHTTQADWTPPATPALFTPTTPAQTNEGEEIVPEWVQPTGGHDAYNVGDKVTFEGQVYKSLIDANTWSPTAYPQGWEEVI